MTAVMLLSASVGGVAVSLFVWVVRGWADGLACYVGTILSIGLLLLWQAGLRPRLTASACSAAPPPAAQAPPGLAVEAGLSLAEPERGLRRIGG